MLRRLPCTGLLLVLLLAQACDTTPEQGIIDPVVAHAPGGHGKPGGGGGSDPLAIEEYFVYTGATDRQQYIHVVASGPVDSISASAILDHFYDGVGENDPGHDGHYEYALLNSEGYYTPEPIGDGLSHVDIPFLGTFIADYTSASTGTRQALPDYPYMEVDGAGGDPWVFHIRVKSQQGNDQISTRPEETYDGSNLAAHSADDLATMTSLTVNHGADAANHTWVQTLSLANVSCQETTVTSGKGKNKTTETFTRVEAEASWAMGFDTEDADDADPWAELHLMDVTGTLVGPHESRMADAYSGLPLQLDVPDGTSTVDVVAVIDYVFARPDWGVYDPGNSEARQATTWDGDPFTSVQDLGDSPPVVRSDTVHVTCNK